MHVNLTIQVPLGAPRLVLDNKVIDETVVCLYKIGNKDDVFYRKTL